MGKIDETKWILPLFLILCIATSILPIVLSWDLLQLDHYASFYGMLEKSYLHQMLLTRVILSNLDYLSFSVMGVIKSIVVNLSMINGIMIILWLYLICAKDETLMKPYKKGCILISVVYLFMHILCACVILFGFVLSSLDIIIALFKTCGIILFCGYLVIVIVSILAFFYYIFHLSQTKRLLL